MLIASKAQMKRIDEILLETYTIEELVGKASDCLLEEIKHVNQLCIVCGSGNNGADGYSLALKLHKMNKRVKVFACKSSDLSEACQFYYDKCLEEHLLIDENEFDKYLIHCELLVDAIFGFGCHSDPRGIYGHMITKMNASRIPILSVDVPSGMDCDSGEVFDHCICASKTVTFFAYKLGFFHPDAQKMIGETLIKVLDVEDLSDKISLCENIDTVSFRKKSYEGHKGSYGKSFLICGSEKYQGAALLSTKASVYTGCGITCLCSDEKVLDQASIFVPEAIHISRTQIDNIKNYQAALIGCGLEHGQHLLKYILFHTELPLVIDASSLNDLSNHLDWLENQKRPIILTPHLGEFRRLCPDMQDPTMSAIEFAKKHHVILILKGPHTLVSDGIHSYRVNSGNGAMASGGCGDVLSGILVSLLAQGYSALDSACKGVYLHGLIGDKLAKERHTVVPSKIIEEIPFVMKQLENM